MLKKLFLIALISFFSCQANIMEEIQALYWAEKEVLFKLIKNIQYSLYGQNLNDYYGKNEASSSNECCGNKESSSNMDDWKNQIDRTDRKIQILLSRIIEKAIEEGERETAQNARCGNFRNLPLTYFIGTSLDKYMGALKYKKAY
jgi:hypothetical protein